jgi:hypothetical protein
VLEGDRRQSDCQTCDPARSPAKASAGREHRQGSLPDLLKTYEMPFRHV